MCGRRLHHNEVVLHVERGEPLSARVVDNVDSRDFGVAWEPEGCQPSVIADLEWCDSLVLALGDIVSVPIAVPVICRQSLCRDFLVRLNLPRLVGLHRSAVRVLRIGED